MKNVKYYIVFLLILSISCTEEEEFTSVNKDLDNKNKKGKIEICHYDKETEQYQTLNVNGNALEAHLAHGDVEGNCDQSVVICKDDETIRVKKTELENYEPFDLGSCEAPGSEYTYIPDDNFEKYLIDNNFDDEPDNLVLTGNIISIGRLEIRSLGIDDLTGIQDFLNLKSLYVDGNNLSELNLSSNLLLTNLYCQYNQLMNLDLSSNKNLKLLYCFNNGMKVLDLPDTSTLSDVSCYRNNLESLNLSQLKGLKYILCFENNLNELNLKSGKNTSIISFASKNNPNLTCIQVDNIEYSIENWTRVDDSSFFSENCNY
ncbi:hypothetical protein [Lutimonas zeaxanthinifaciens]|uniref:hypothetical protein n=1 Tax=Lutimonas zeaxanthinifaciens TaxID=3060215 RepID=UPI00265C8EEB|nr:hypothetical protein [Lutimonas sp. YSD2104]WKK67374.1 hypothetical protein QZH61_07030 [Lutimonas sp. YSD2104]